MVTELLYTFANQPFESGTALAVSQCSNYSKSQSRSVPFGSLYQDCLRSIGIVADGLGVIPGRP